MRRLGGRDVSARGRPTAEEESFYRANLDLAPESPPLQRQRQAFRATPGSGARPAPTVRPDIWELVTMHADVQGLPAEVKDYNPENSRLGASRGLEASGLLGQQPLSIRGRHGGGSGQQNEPPRPPIDKAIWYADYTDSELQRLLAMPHDQRHHQHKLYACVDDPATRLMSGYNYTKQVMVWVGHETQVPHKLTVAATGRVQEGVQKSAPPILTLPVKIPSITRGSAAALVIVRDMEAYVESGSRVYSPMRLWTDRARKERNEETQKDATLDGKIDPTLFSRRCAMYCYLITVGSDAEVLTAKNGPRGVILCSESEIREAKDSWAKTQTRFVAVGTKPVAWASLALEAAADRVHRGLVWQD